MHWTTSRFEIDLTRPRVMGIVNVTPDSFSDGGHHASASAAIAHCERLLADGADLLDIGGESSRPGAEPVAADDEWARIAPVIGAAVKLGCPVSVDTCKTEVMRRALDAGADVVNDIGALQAPGAIDALAAFARAGVCLMHMQGTPQTMQRSPEYGDVVAEVRDFLAARAAACGAAGIARERIVVDPGIGFGKTAAHNVELLRGQRGLLALGLPVLVGWSRKSVLGALTGRKTDERLVASVAAALAALQQGAHIVRVHDVAATVDAIRLWEAAGLAGARA